MKAIIFSGLLICSTMALAGQDTDIPKCVNIGTRSEGWVIPGRQGIAYDNCAQKKVECGAIGTRSEGWYAVELKADGLLGYANCKNSKDAPKCVSIGTRSESWLFTEGTGKVRYKYANCAGKVVECSAIGTRSEGWYIFEKLSSKLLMYATCSVVPAHEHIHGH